MVSIGEHRDLHRSNSIFKIGLFRRVGPERIAGGGFTAVPVKQPRRYLKWLLEQGRAWSGQACAVVWSSRRRDALRRITLFLG